MYMDVLELCSPFSNLAFLKIPKREQTDLILRYSDEIVSNLKVKRELTPSRAYKWNIERRATVTKLHFALVGDRHYASINVDTCFSVVGHADD
jgi:hypothetical protein